MSLSDKNRFFRFPTYKRALVYAVAAGFIFPLIAIFIVLINQKLSIDPSNIISIHGSHPEIFLFYLLPLLFVLVVMVWNIIRTNETEHYREMINKSNQIISRNAAFAEEIGKGNYNVDITPEGENDLLGKSLLVMRQNLLANYKKESEQNWISEGRNLISNILRIYNKLEELADHVLEHLVKYTEAIQGAVYLFDEEDEKLVSLATYAYSRKKFIHKEFKLGFGLVGQCAYEKDYIYRTEIPEDYITLTSGILGDQKPGCLLIVPLISDDQLQGIIEIASLKEEIPELTIRLVKELGNIIARTIFNLRVNQKTEHLLEDSQKMTIELRENEEKLKENAEEMRATQEELRNSNQQLESKILEVENAQTRLYRLLENASEIISIYNSDQLMTYVSPSAQNILGYSAEELMKGKDMERLSLEGQSGMQQVFEQVIQKPDLTPTIEYSFVRKDGQIVFLETTVINRLDDQSIKGIILNSRDITERRRAAKEERLKTRMQSLSENSLDMIIRLSVEGRFYYANPIVENYTGNPPGALFNKNLSEVQLSDELKEYFEKTLDDIKKDPEKSNTELTLPVRAGVESTKQIMSIDAIPEFNEDELETILFVGHDITEAKRIEQEIQIKNRKIEDSINYAERIQSSILPGIKLVQQHLPKSFFYYKPKDVISGDFPWFFAKNNAVYIAAVDCTGHGVPGALLSFVGYFLLNNLVERNVEYTAGQICDQLHQGVRYTLKQNTEDADARDGMDIAFCKIDLANQELHFSGAHRPLYLLRNGEIEEYKGDRKAIGGIPSRKRPEFDFTNHVIKIRNGDRIFFFTDGLPDQLGGPEKKKYSPKRIREIITDNPGFTMNQYKTRFMKDFEEWMGDLRQIDDVLIIGIEF